MQKPAVKTAKGLEYSVLSDIGLRRGNNQDSYAVVPAADDGLWRQRGHVFLVADGMGAHAAGELASELAAEKIPHLYGKHIDQVPPDALREAIVEANHEIHSRGQANIDFHGMGTTASVLLLLPQGALVGQVGDSRVYRLRGKRLDQLSFDHSLVWEMIASGQVDQNDVPKYIPKNIITRSLGPNPDVQVDLEGPFPLELGDTFLLCSDGLSGQVADDELGTILGCLPPDEAAQTLVDLANLRGGPDNITLIIVRVTGSNLVRNEPSDWHAAPGPSGGRGPQVPVAVWVVLGVLMLLALAMLAAGQYLPAAVALAASVVTSIWAWLRWFENAAPGATLPTTRFGKGPHRTYNCEPNGAFVDRLGQVVAQLRDAANEEQWAVDWEPFEALEREATTAAERKDYVAAVRAYSHAITFMMGELRQQGDGNTPDEVVRRSNSPGD